jgi:hypothetical protein
MRQGKPARRQARERERERERERDARTVYATFFSRSSYIWFRVFMLASSELAAAELWEEEGGFECVGHVYPRSNRMRISSSNV